MADQPRICDDDPRLAVCPECRQRIAITRERKLAEHARARLTSATRRRPGRYARSKTLKAYRDARTSCDGSGASVDIEEQPPDPVPDEPLRFRAVAAEGPGASPEQLAAAAEERRWLADVDQAVAELRGKPSPRSLVISHAAVAAEFEALVAAGTTEDGKIVDRHDDWAEVYWRAAQVYLAGTFRLREPENLLTGGIEIGGRRVEITARYVDGATPTEIIGFERELRVERERHLLQLAALLHNVRHLLVRVEGGKAPKRPHEQDRIDAARWLPEIDRALAELPKPKTRIIPAGELGGADPVEYYFEDQDE